MTTLNNFEYGVKGGDVEPPSMTWKKRIILMLLAALVIMLMGAACQILSPDGDGSLQFPKTQNTYYV